LAPGGGLAPDQHTWRPTPSNFFLPVKALSPIFRAKFREALRETDCFPSVPASVWDQDWVVHCQPVGDGLKAFKYLAPYIFRVALSNSRLVSCENNQVTFRYRDSKTGQSKLLALEPFEFIHRFLQHVLPTGFVKVRYYGLLSPGCRPSLALVRQHLTPANAEPVTPTPPTTEPDPPTTSHPAPPSNSDSETATPPPGPSAAASDTPTSEPSLLVELEDEPNSPDEPPGTSAAAASDTPTSEPSLLVELEDEPNSPDEPPDPAPPSSAPRCPACGQLMRRRATLTPKGRSPP